MKFLNVLMVLFVSFFPGVASAQVEVPPVFHFQSQLFDDGGNFLADGVRRIRFRIVNAEREVLYEEEQELDVVHGGVSALVGNGLDPETGLVKGGVPRELFFPTEPRYLEVEVEGLPAEGPMEFVSVPYALYARESVGVLPGGVESAAIVDGALQFRHFSSSAVTELTAAVLSSGGSTPNVVTVDALSAPAGASSIGVSGAFANTSATNVQGVLSGIDGSVANVRNDLNAEVSARQSADGSLQSSLNQNRAAHDASVIAWQQERAGLQAQIDAVDGFPKVRAWGYALNGTFAGSNATLSSGGFRRINVSFPQALATAHYAVVVTPLNPARAATSSYVASPSANGFTVGFSDDVGGFSFMVVY